MSTTNSEKVYLRSQLEAIGARRVLEIGAYKGETTRVLRASVASRGGYVAVIDPMRSSSEFFRNGIMRHLGGRLTALGESLERLTARATYEPAFWRNVGVDDGISLHLFRSLSTDPELLERADPRLAEFDAVFIDGDHSYEGARSDLLRWGRRVRPGGCILIHDAVPRFRGVMRALREWEFDPRVTVSWPTSGTICTINVLDRLRPSAAASVLEDRAASHRDVRHNGHTNGAPADGGRVVAPSLPT